MRVTRPPPRPEDRGRQPKVLRSRDLDVVGAAAHQRGPQARAPRSPRLRPSLARPRSRHSSERAAQHAVTEQLGRQRAPQAVARHRGGDEPGVIRGASACRATGIASSAPDRVARRRRASSRCRSSRPQAGSRGIVHQHPVGCPAATARQALEQRCATDSSRRSPPIQLPTRALRRLGQSCEAPVAGRNARPRLPAMEGSASRTRSDQDSSGARRAAAGTASGRRAPKRSPRPAAGTTAQRRTALVIGSRPAPSAVGAVAAVRRRALPGRRRHDLEERLVGADHAEIGAGAFLERGLPFLEVANFGRERLVALLEPRRFPADLRRDRLLEPPDLAHAAARRPRAGTAARRSAASRRPVMMRIIMGAGD